MTNAQRINVARPMSGFLGALAPDVQGLFPALIATPDDAQNAEVREATGEQLAQLYFDTCDFLDDHISGFWSTWSPAQRLEVYEQNEPVLIDGAAFPQWLSMAAEYAMAVQMGMIDEVQAKNQVVAALLAPGSMWAEMWGWEPLECEKMIKDYASEQTKRDKRHQADEGEINVADMLEAGT